MEVSDNQDCFVCGQDNPVGLKTTIAVDRDARSAQVTLAVPADFQGWKGMVHGGIISALLDEACAAPEQFRVAPLHLKLAFVL